MAFPYSSATSEERHDEHGSTDDDENQGGQASRISGHFVGKLFAFRRVISGYQTQYQ